MKITVTRGQKSLKFDMPPSASVFDLKKAYSLKDARFYPDRIRFSFEKNGARVVLVDDKKSLESYGVADGTEVILKDLGPQIGYQTVFYIEYFGPMLIHFLFYYFPEFFYGPGNLFNRFLPFLFGAYEVVPKNQVQNVIFGMVIAHFLKREFETAFVHKFSHATMPIFNLYKNCAHYWVSGGLGLGYIAYRPDAPLSTSSTVLYLAVALYVFSELSNLQTHLILSRLRKPGSTERKIPRGYGFNLVSCPNYFFEIMAWVSVTLLVPHFLSIFFLVTGAGQMWFWAVKKHKQYKKDFPDYPKGRKVMIPFLA